MIERFPPDSEVVKQGDPGEKFYMVGRGELDVVVQTGGQESLINTLRDGDYFGELALLGGDSRTATVRTRVASELYSLSLDAFKSLLERDPGVGEAIQQSFIQRRAAYVAASDAVMRDGSPA